MRKVVLTGGPCSGKTTVAKAIAEAFRSRIIAIPEVASMLLQNFPLPGRDLEWCSEWQKLFQKAVLPNQISLEDSWELSTKNYTEKIMLCDRGLLDGAIYTPGGQAMFCKLFSVNLEAAFARYHTVIHLESLATFSPKEYGPGGNDVRFETLEQAQLLEHAARNAWKGHRNLIFVSGEADVVDKTLRVREIIQNILAEE